jgi:uncharacterized membrane protein
LGLIFGFVPSIIGVVIAYLYIDDAKGSYLESHYQFQIRTFWYALVLCLSGIVLSLVLIGWLVLFLTLVWYIIRNIRGLRDLTARRPIPDPVVFLGFGG